MSQSRLEIKVGLFVLFCLALLVVLLLQFSKGVTIFRPTYDIILKSANVGGLRSKATVLMSGVQVGTVSSIELLPQGTNVAIDLKIYSQFVIRDDALFKIEQSGFLGDQYVAIYPGTGLGTYYIEDILDLPNFAKLLREKPDPVSAFVSDQLDPDTKMYLGEYSPKDTDVTNILTLLAQNLNRLVLGPSIYDAARFQNVKLRPSTQELLKQDLKGQELARLNRLLLDDAFPEALSAEDEGQPFKSGAIAHAQEPFNLQEVARSAQGFIQRMDETAKKVDDAISEVRRVVLNDKTLMNLDMSIANLRKVSESAITTVDNINSLLKTNGAPTTAAISNLYAFSGQLNGFADRAQEILNTNGPQIYATISNLHSSSAMLTNLLAGIQAGHGLAGRALKDEEMADNIDAVSRNLAVTTSNLNRLGFWHWLWYKPKPAGTNTSSASVSNEHKR